jgi:peptidoglycan/xylan/chitin deacetylase (PgdA/CDA1 family)
MERDKTVHSLLKRSFERALSSSWVSAVTRKRVRGKRLILAYHGIIPEGAAAAGERTLFMAQRDFAAHLDVLAEIADVAPLARIDDEGDGRPRVAITLDDAYRGAVCEGVGELVKRSMPATIFVAPARLDGHVFWWDALSSGSGALDDGLRSHALNALAGSDERVRAWAASAAVQGSDDLPQYARTATRAELRTAVGNPGITLGSHTWSHRNLARLDIAEIVSEVRRSRASLKSEFGASVIDWLAYPYGLDSVAAQQAVADASYVGALRISGGWHNAAQTSAFARPRLNVPAGLSIAGLKTHLVGAMLS